MKVSEEELTVKYGRFVGSLKLLQLVITVMAVLITILDR